MARRWIGRRSGRSRIIWVGPVRKRVLATGDVAYIRAARMLCSCGRSFDVTDVSHHMTRTRQGTSCGGCHVCISDRMIHARARLDGTVRLDQAGAEAILKTLRK